MLKDKTSIRSVCKWRHPKGEESQRHGTLETLGVQCPERTKKERESKFEASRQQCTYTALDMYEESCLEIESLPARASWRPDSLCLCGSRQWTTDCDRYQGDTERAWLSGKQKKVHDGRLAWSSRSYCGQATPLKYNSLKDTPTQDDFFSLDANCIPL